MPANSKLIEQGPVHAFLQSNPYAYLTVYRGDTTVCEGTIRSLSRIVDISGFQFKSFFTMYTEDGGVEIEAAI